MSIEAGQTYKNEVGAVMVIKQNAIMEGISVISSDIWVAVSQDKLFGPMGYLVTKKALNDAGYVLIEDAPDVEGKDS